MGQYLAIGLTTEIKINKKEVEESQTDIEQLQGQMKRELHYVSEIYELREDEKAYRLGLREELFQAQLLSFLEHLYPHLYSSEESYERVLQRLRDLAPSEWLEWAKGKPAEAFQIHLYGNRDYLRMKSGEVRIAYEHILLSMEGKILMEYYMRQFNFLKYTMRETFKPFEIAGALNLYMTS